LQNIIEGRITLLGSRVAVPDLVVVAIDASPDGGKLRLGSTITSSDGRFSIAYDDLGDGRRPDLLLATVAPARGDHGGETLFESAEPRRSAARRETFLVELDPARLEKAGIALPGSEAELEPTETFAKRLGAAVAHEGSTREAWRSVALARVQAQRANETATLAAVTRLRASLSPGGGPGFVGDGDSVHTVQHASLMRGRERLAQRRARLRITLSAAELAALEAEFPTLSDIPLTRVLPHLDSSSGASSLFGSSPVALACRGTALGTEPCAQLLQPGVEPAPEPSQPALPEDPLTAGVADKIGELVARITPPEMAPVIELPQDVGAADVDAKVQGFGLASGPADTAAFHDFHALEIAFEHVWQEAFDDDLLDVAEDLYGRIVELGGSIDGPTSSRRSSPLHLLRAEARLVATAMAESSALHGETGGARLLARPHGDDFGLPDRWLPPIVGGGIRPPHADVGGIVAPPSVRADEIRGLLAELEAKLKEPYAFTIYAANRHERSVNFGLLATYRQMWEPLAYQAGELVRTVTLAPKESRKYAKRTIVRKKRAEKEAETRVESRRRDTSDTSRAEAEVLRKAEAKTNFSLATEGSYNVGISKGTATAGFGKDAASSSEEAKKDFREAVLHAAEEYRQERTVEVSFEAGEDVEAEESGELSNPNDEIPVTYLFYELQRRYRVSETIHRAMPVVLVAQEVPKPSEITEAWLVAHDWILARVLLDDTFRPALRYLANGMTGDRHMLEVLRQHVEQHRALVNKLGDELTLVREQVGRRYSALERSLENRASVVAGEGGEGMAEKAWEWFAGGSPEESAEAARMREDAARDAYERIEREEKEVRARLDRAVSALQTATDQYAKSLAEKLDRDTQIMRLRLHVKQNILHYMQAIWLHEPPDQRFFRLHKVRTPRLEGTVTLTRIDDPDALPRPPDWTAPPTSFTAAIELAPMEYADLVELADLDNMIGFKGNYMIFPLKRSNALTDYMLAPYLDLHTGLRDPDELGNWTPHSLLRYVCCLRDAVAAGRLSMAELESFLPALREIYRRLLSDPRRSTDTIAVPSGSLFIEALLGTHALLEPYKLAHRMIDVKKVQAEVRGLELENLRAAARLIADELEDKDIEKKIVIEGGSAIVVPEDE
jgi:hypothetical protein